MALTQETILTFLLEHGGKVKNSELVSKFKGLLNSSDPAEKKRNRDLFKRLVNNVAVVKQVDDVKYVAVKKKYQLENDLKCSKPEIVDIINNNYCHCSTQTVRNSSASDCNVESLTARVLSVTSDARSGSVFALVAVKSPQCEMQNDQTRFKTLTADAEPVKTIAYHISGEGFPYGAKREAQGSPHLRKCTKITKCDAIPLGSVEHEWLVKSATGSWRQISSLLLEDPHLAEKRNFMSGFTILHWAAKSGNGEMVCKVIDVSRQSGAGIDVNAKCYDGYTPLHIAAIHSRERVCSLLVCEYGASADIRDNSGKKPYRYLSQDVSTEVRKMLGDPRCVQQDAGNYLKDEQNLRRGFSTLSKLFQPHGAGHKKKYRRRPSFHFIREKEHCT
ncbi:Ankyrin repeat domain-containing protein SOWAHA [Anabarilius grahami]|uniref:Ankyrin repeat domain-containing protein SOWAHA n=1 Tax=Anabarilius grahami TaxID=495550 RepID=A0A3N0ZAS2_ANAGA|nr:Ankyrin repeat domain-containing protein SOWAHA [Anabarilius grahami]